VAVVRVGRTLESDVIVVEGEVVDGRAAPGAAVDGRPKPKVA
jgi:hypothetical protein